MFSVLVCLAILVVVAILVGMAIRDRIAFRERFPPISDAQFMALCPPGTSPDVALRVRRIVAEALAVEYDRIYPSSRLIEDLGAD